VRRAPQRRPLQLRPRRHEPEQPRRPRRAELQRQLPPRRRLVARRRRETRWRGGARCGSESVGRPPVPHPFTIFLLSPANLGGQRARVVCNPHAEFELARQLRSPEGAALGELFSFVSGLYFRGKAAYAAAFGRAPEGLASGLVISAGEGLRPL